MERNNKTIGKTYKTVEVYDSFVCAMRGKLKKAIGEKNLETLARTRGKETIITGRYVVVVDEFTNTVTFIDLNYDGWDTSKKGVAKCNDSDEFDALVGLAIAYARAYGYKLPDSYTNEKKKETIKKPITEVQSGERISYWSATTDKPTTGTVLYSFKADHNSVVVILSNDDTKNVDFTVFHSGTKARLAD